MKKFILFLAFLFLINPASAAAGADFDETESELINKISDTESIKLNKTQITDELLNPDLYEKYPFKLGVYTNKYKDMPITDGLIDEDFIKNSSKFVIQKAETPDEYFIEKGIDLSKTRRILPKTKYDFNKEVVSIKIKIANNLKSLKNIKEGDEISFLSTHEFSINGKTFPEGTDIKGRVETISASDKMGTPEEIKIDNFYINDEGKEILLAGHIRKSGANRALWVYPLYQAGNITLYAAGFILVPIHGGRVKLSDKNIYTVVYEP